MLSVTEPNCATSMIWKKKRRVWWVCSWVFLLLDGLPWWKSLWHNNCVAMLKQNWPICVPVLPDLISLHGNHHLNGDNKEEKCWWGIVRHPIVQWLHPEHVRNWFCKDLMKGTASPDFPNRLKLRAISKCTPLRYWFTKFSQAYRTMDNWVHLWKFVQICERPGKFHVALFISACMVTFCYKINLYHRLTKWNKPPVESHVRDIGTIN